MSPVYSVVNHGALEFSDFHHLCESVFCRNVCAEGIEKLLFSALSLRTLRPRRLCVRTQTRNLGSIGDYSIQSGKPEGVVLIYCGSGERSPLPTQPLTKEKTNGKPIFRQRDRPLPLEHNF